MTAGSDEDDVLARLAQELAEEEARPLAPLRRAEGRRGSDASMAWVDAAQNLLEKARRRAAAGDADRARGLVERALALPYDEREQQEPGPWGAHLLLFTAFGDDMEDSDEGDVGWLDRVEKVIAGTHDSEVAWEIRACLPALLDLGATRQEERRLERLIRGVPRDAEPLAGVRGQESRTRVILGMLDALTRYEDLWEQDAFE